ncbi:hypothetical protein [Priestia megaterium]|uniref:hypothetical protein n=1 Tax=Priestia megaterium TaxID=1404 RepID=UPI000BFD5241|nr:hypothetical protein [Priestia megaterium]PGQ88179.1 hypothetical protein COA18_04445 [Priestia megaterium]
MSEEIKGQQGTVIVDEEIEREGVYVSPKAVIRFPDNYSKLIESQLKEYKGWLKENKKLQAKADEAETDEEMEEALKACTTHFKTRYAGVIAKDQGERLSPSKIKRIWENFMRYEFRSFLDSHINLPFESLLKIGIDKFIYTLGWRKPSDTASWHNNVVRIGTCCHCNDQFIPMMFQQNHGLCSNCRPLYSVTAIRNYILHVMHQSERYENATHDLLMDFYIMFYSDPKLRKLFLKGTETAKEFESLQEDENNETN